MKFNKYVLAAALCVCLPSFCVSQSNSPQSGNPDQNAQPTQSSPDSGSQPSNSAAQPTSQADPGNQNGPENNALKSMAESTKAIDYREGSKSDVELKGTSLMPEAGGKAEVQTKSGASQVKVDLSHLNPANSFGLQYLTYVLWAISPEGVPSNLGELIVHDSKASLHATTPMQAFALIVSAEPYYAVTQPSEKVIAQNEPGNEVKGWIRAIDVQYQVLPAAAYASQVAPIQEPVYGVDKNVPLSLKVARNAVRIAKIAHADQYASPALDRAQQLLSQADNYYNQKQNDKAIATVAREATQAAEAARVSAMKAEQQAKIDAEQRAAQEKAAQAQAQAEEQTRQAQQAQAQAQEQMQKTQQAEAARQAAEQQAAQAQAAAQQAAAAAQTAQQQLQQQAGSGQVQADQQAAAQQAQEQAERARQDAAAAQQRAQDQERQAQQAEQELQQQQAAAQQAQQQLQQLQQQNQLAQQQLQQEEDARKRAEQQAANSQQQLQQTQQQLQQAQSDKEQVRQRLLGQLNQVLQTKDSARGLIVNMPDVLFNLNSASLKPDARERLAKVAGILIAYPDIHVEVDGYTDNTGSVDYNQQLSEQRADTVRQYLVQQGVPSNSVDSKGFGPNDPIASNDSPDGRRQNRRVNLVVSGQSIGAQMATPTAGQ